MNEAVRNPAGLERELPNWDPCREPVWWSPAMRLDCASGAEV